MFLDSVSCRGEAGFMNLLHVEMGLIKSGCWEASGALQGGLEDYTSILLFSKEVLQPGGGGVASGGAGIKQN